MADPEAFSDFLDTCPGMAPYAKAVFILINEEATRLGNEMRAEHSSPAALRFLAARYKAEGLEWLAGQNSALAEAFERDVRFAAIPALAGWASRNFSIAFLNWYQNYLEAFLKARGEPSRMTLQAAE